MKNKKLFRGSFPESCAVCAKGRPSASGEAVFCELCGVMAKNGHCRRFEYDPLKRTPAVGFSAKDFTEDDFKI